MLTTICSSKSAHGQKLVFLFGHVLYAIPADQNFEKNYSSGFGVEGGIGLGTGRTFFVGTVGYSSFSAFETNPFGKLSYVPIKVGIRRYLLVGKLLFINGDAGIGILQNGLYHGSRFSGDIGLGVKLGPLEVMAAYDGYVKPSSEGSGYSSWIGIKIGMTFGF
ncbi:MAG: hypothetical protein ACHQEM_10670 [Chitinophagales bacterium]